MNRREAMQATAATATALFLPQSGAVAYHAAKQIPETPQTARSAPKDYIIVIRAGTFTKSATYDELLKIAKHWADNRDKGRSQRVVMDEMAEFIPQGLVEYREIYFADKTKLVIQVGTRERPGSDREVLAVKRKYQNALNSGVTTFVSGTRSHFSTEKTKSGKWVQVYADITDKVDKTFCPGQTFHSPVFNFQVPTDIPEGVVIT